jgi:hypothetical protein
MNDIDPSLFLLFLGGGTALGTEMSLTQKSQRESL